MILGSAIIGLHLHAATPLKSVLNVVLEVAGEEHAIELGSNAQQKNLTTVTAPAWFDRSQLTSFQSDQIRHALEQKNATNDKPTNKSYYLVLDFQDLKTMEEDSVPNCKGWKSKVVGYLYRIDRSSFNRRINRTNYPIFYVGTANFPLQVSSPIGYATTSNQLLKELIQKGFDGCLDSLQNQLDRYVEQAPILQKHPLRANIGKREDIRVDDRFLAYDYVYDAKTFQTKKVFRGIARATHSIVDNRDTLNTNGSTVFYQTYGSPLKLGDVLVKRMNSGYEWSLAKSSGGVGGWSARLDARLSRHVGIQSVYLFLEGGIDKQVQSYSYYYGRYHALYRIDGGLAKGLQLYRNLELRPYAGLGLESTTYGLDVSGIMSEYQFYGANLYLQVNRFLKVFGGYSRYTYKSFWSYFDQGSFGTSWTSYFRGRDTGTLSLGITVEL